MEERERERAKEEKNGSEKKLAWICPNGYDAYFNWKK